MATQLSNAEKAICARIGISESDFIAQRVCNGVALMSVSADPRHVPQARLLPQIGGLSDADRDVIRATQVHPRDYVAMKTTGNIGIGARRELIVQDATRDMTAAEIAREAIKELQAFLRDPEHLDSMQSLINGSGLLDSALKNIGAARLASGGY